MKQLIISYQKKHYQKAISKWKALKYVFSFPLSVFLQKHYSTYKLKSRFLFEKLASLPFSDRILLLL